MGIYVSFCPHLFSFVWGLLWDRTVHCPRAKIRRTKKVSSNQLSFCHQSSLCTHRSIHDCFSINKVLISSSYDGSYVFQFVRRAEKQKGSHTILRCQLLYSPQFYFPLSEQHLMYFNGTALLVIIIITTILSSKEISIIITIIVMTFGVIYPPFHFSTIKFTLCMMKRLSLIFHFPSSQKGLILIEKISFVINMKWIYETLWLSLCDITWSCLTYLGKIRPQPTLASESLLVPPL